MKVEIKIADIWSEELFVRLILNREAVFDFLDFLKVRSQELTTFALDKGLGSFLNERSDQWILDHKLDVALIVDFAENCNHWRIWQIQVANKLDPQILQQIRMSLEKLKVFADGR